MLPEKPGWLGAPDLLEIRYSETKYLAVGLRRRMMIFWNIQDLITVFFGYTQMGLYIEERFDNFEVPKYQNQRPKDDTHNYSHILLDVRQRIAMQKIFQHPIHSVTTHRLMKNIL